MSYDDRLNTALVIDCIPVIDSTKSHKLFSKIAKEFSRKGISIDIDDIFMPWDSAADRSKGCAA